MSDTCKFPACSRIVEKNGYCFLHKIYSDMPETKEPKKPIAKASKKREVSNKEYKKIVKEMLGANNKCEVKSPDCTKLAQGLHHLQKRSPSNLTDKKNLIRCCNACNLFIENNVDWGIEKGFQVSRFSVTAIAERDHTLNTTIIEPIK